MSTSKPLKTLSSPQNSHEIRSAFTRDGSFTNFKQVFFRTFHTHRIAARTFAFTMLSVLAWFTATTHALDISQGWRFTKGDDPVWAQPEFDDSVWKPIYVGTPWEKAGHDGYGWYRLRVSVPAEASEGAYFKHYQRLTLLLGAVDDVDVTCFNGVEVGRTGSAPEKMDRPTDSPKDYLLYPEAGHGTPPEHLVAKTAWIRERFALEK